MEEGEDIADIDQRTVGVVQRGIVETGEGKVELLETFADVATCHFSSEAGGEIAAVEFSDPACIFFGLPLDIDVAHSRKSFDFLWSFSVT
jgi:hypothetical protein